MSKLEFTQDWGLVTVPDIDEESLQEWTASKLPAEVLIKSLYERGTPYEEVFRIFYALEEQAGARTLTVEDAYLAGYNGKPTPVADF